MAEATEFGGTSENSQLSMLARAARLFDDVRRVRDPQLCALFVRQLDTFLVAVARSRSAIDIAIGERLDALSSGDRAMDLSYSSVGDYARERLGIAASTAEKMARFARALRERPLLREAVRGGEVSLRRAEAVLPAARGEAEQFWVERARRETVRALKLAVKEPASDDDEPFVRFCAEVPPEKRQVLDDAMEMAGQLLDATAPKWQRLGALCEEYLSDHPEWDEVFGHLAMLFVRMQGWRLLEFASLEHYAEERLGMCGRALQQRASLERSLERLRPLGQALRSRRLSYEQARLIARYAEESDIEGWIERAVTMTCIELRSALQSDEDAKMCARGDFAAVVPLHLRSLLRQAFDAVRNAEGRWLSPGECFVRIAEHFLEVWKPLLAGRITPQKEILARDLGRCQVPGCSRAAKHVHHIVFRSAGGSDAPENLVSLCPAHHLRGIHMGRIRVKGRAPHALRWELGIQRGMEPFLVIEPRAPSP